MLRRQRVLMPQWDVPSQTERPIVGKAFVGIWGVLLPILLLFYGLACIASQEAVIVSFRDVVMLSGANAIAAGFAIMAVGGLLHLLCFWDAVYESNRPRGRGPKLLCLLILGASTYFICYQMISQFRNFP